jgi:hypothetical protein
VERLGLRAAVVRTLLPILIDKGEAAYTDRELAKLIERSEDGVWKFVAKILPRLGFEVERPTLPGNGTKTKFRHPGLRAIFERPSETHITQPRGVVTVAQPYAEPEDEPYDEPTTREQAADRDEHLRERERREQLAEQERRQRYDRYMPGSRCKVRIEDRWHYGIVSEMTDRPWHAAVRLDNGDEVTGCVDDIDDFLVIDPEKFDLLYPRRTA